jgi:hypothetical protein
VALQQGGLLCTPWQDHEVLRRCGSRFGSGRMCLCGRKTWCWAITGTMDCRPLGLPGAENLDGGDGNGLGCPDFTSPMDFATRHNKRCVSN